MLDLNTYAVPVWNDKWSLLLHFLSAWLVLIFPGKICFAHFPRICMCLFVVFWLAHRCKSYAFISCFLSLYFSLTVGCYLLLFCEQTDPASVPQLAWQFVAAQKAVNPILAFCRGDTVHFLLVRIMSIAFFTLKKKKTDSKMHCESLLKHSVSVHKIHFLA